jgi:thioredoxin 1
MRSINMFDYESELAKSDQLVVLDFYADWCAPCSMIAPMMTQLGIAYEGQVEFAKVDVDVQRALAGAFDVLSIPTVVLVKNGQEVDRVVGAKPILHYQSMIEKAI